MMYQSKELCVSNQNVQGSIMMLDRKTEFEQILNIINDKGVSDNSFSNNAFTPRRSDASISIGMQTIYAHQQHKSRYCMLPHSAPFVPTVKTHDGQLLERILAAHHLTSKVIFRYFRKQSQGFNPFSLEDLREIPEAERNIHLQKRSEVFDIMFGDIPRKNGSDVPKNYYNMFEACTVQETGMLRFHRDTRNCPLIDDTVAVHIPSRHDMGQRCISFMFYTRKCVGDFSHKMGTIKKYIMGTKINCGLTILCLKSLLEVKGIFNYQGSLFENSKSLKTIATELVQRPEYQSPEVSRFTGLSCFKYGTAFDKMGYYSCFLNILLSMHYLG